MQLFFTDVNFVWRGLPRPGIPFLCDNNMELVAAANYYLRFVSAVRGRTRSPKTWQTYGNHMYEFFSFVEAEGYNWTDLNASLLAAWRDQMLDRGCSRSTVNQRLRCVSTFYNWSVQANIVSFSPFSFENIRVSKHRGFLTHVDATGNQFSANTLTVQTFTSIPQFLVLSEALKFLDALKPYSLKLMGYLGLLTGMRRSEITGLSYKVVPNPCGYDSKKHLPLILDAATTPTKGSKTRTVMIPYDLAVALWDYFCTEWPRRNSQYQKRHGRESSRFFLSAKGEELSERYLNNSFSKFSALTNIKCHPHMLRHTFATYELLRMTGKYGQDRALLWLRERLGHSSITTTEIYTHAIDILNNNEVDGYQNEILRKFRDGA